VPPRVKLRDIFLLMIGAIIAEFAVVVTIQVFNPSRFLTVMVTVTVGSVWWIVGYQRIAHPRLGKPTRSVLTR
jgi:hypothetical protein